MPTQLAGTLCRRLPSSTSHEPPDVRNYWILVIWYVKVLDYASALLNIGLTVPLLFHFFCRASPICRYWLCVVDHPIRHRRNQATCEEAQSTWERLGRIRLTRIRLGRFRLGRFCLGRLRIGWLRLGLLRLGRFRLGRFRLRQLQPGPLRLGRIAASLC